MRNDTYAKHIKSVLQRLNLICSKILHLGRNLGAKILDPLQEEESSIDAMGQWAQTVRRSCYSSQLPMRPIKRMAGFEEGKFYMLTRGQVEPSPELRRMTPMGCWCYNSLQDLTESSEPGQHKTAIKFLSFLCYLNDVWLQDAAAMMVLHPDREAHPMFQDLTVFGTVEFEVRISCEWRLHCIITNNTSFPPSQRFKERMKHELQNETLPFNAAMENVLPGLQAWQSANHAQVKAVNSKVDTVVEAVNRLGDKLDGGLLTAESQQLLREDLAKSLVSVAQDLLQSGSPTRSPVSVAASSPATHCTDCTEVSPFDDSDTVAQLATLTGTAPFSNPMQDPKASPHLNFRMRVKHDTLLNVYSEWKGLGAFEDEYGGIAGRDALFKKQGASWRQHLNGMHYSRTKRTVEAIEAFAEQENISPAQACTLLQTAFEASKCSVGNFVKHCQGIGLLSKKQARGRKKKLNS